MFAGSETTRDSAMGWSTWHAAPLISDQVCNSWTLSTIGPMLALSI